PPPKPISSQAALAPGIRASGSIGPLAGSGTAMRGIRVSNRAACFALIGRDLMRPKERSGPCALAHSGRSASDGLGSVSSVMARALDPFRFSRNRLTPEQWSKIMLGANICVQLDECPTERRYSL